MYRYKTLRTDGVGWVVNGIETQQLHSDSLRNHRLHVIRVDVTLPVHSDVNTLHVAAFDDEREEEGDAEHGERLVDEDLAHEREDEGAQPGETLVGAEREGVEDGEHGRGDGEGDNEKPWYGYTPPGQGGLRLGIVDLVETEFVCVNLLKANATLG